MSTLVKALLSAGWLILQELIGALIEKLLELVPSITSWLGG